MKHHLLLCHTPLQTLIAEQIIAAHPNDTFDLVLHSYFDNAKFRHYFNRLAQHCRRSEFILLQHSRKLPRLLQLLGAALPTRPHYHSVFVSSIDSLYWQTLISHTRFQQLFTFDDGLANITPDSIFYQTPVLPAASRLLRRALGVRFDAASLRQISQAHYTLYPEFANIARPLRPVSLLPDFPEHPSNTPTETVRIFLGQPVFGDAQRNTELARRIVRQFAISHYFPHPREHSHALPDIEYIDTPLVIEDYLMQQLTQQPTHRYELYTLFSSVALHLPAHPRLSITAIRPSLPYFAENVPARIYAMMRQRGIPLAELDCATP